LELDVVHTRLDVLMTSRDVYRTFTFPIRQYDLCVSADLERSARAQIMRSRLLNT